ncbi:5-bromo-4-chloroindolyl phosphate hydrolysis family protein [Mesobacillus harenae]|uniref:5-bromo-4-chloroindolyl phosphate hydrolysis family protein n=1 Tax=Mesobacillus harenae TaxID=2213203 RepID=UPI001580EFEE|nr:5-bromo-4-chloroindolyl phosphate hydrolysis family protein [Mesobacillus harenae]
MNPFITFLAGAFAAIPVAITVWFVSFFGFDQAFMLSSLISLTGGAATYWLTAVVLKGRFLKRHQLTRKEYQYIKKNTEEAKHKLKRLHKVLFKIRHVPSLKQRMDLLRMTRKIYKLTLKEPKRFYKAETFYFSHLDSVLELSEKYAFLASQPTKNRELEHSLFETRQTLYELTQAVERDLDQIISDDLDHLNFEIDVAKHTIKTHHETQAIEENRRLK